MKISRESFSWKIQQLGNEGFTLKFVNCLLNLRERLKEDISNDIKYHIYLGTKRYKFAQNGFL